MTRMMTTTTATMIMTMNDDDNDDEDDDGDGDDNDDGDDGDDDGDDDDDRGGGGHDPISYEVSHQTTPETVSHCQLTATSVTIITMVFLCWNLPMLIFRAARRRKMNPKSQAVSTFPLNKRQKRIYLLDLTCCRHRSTRFQRLATTENKRQGNWIV